jgi:hypothetical protein
MQHNPYIPCHEVVCKTSYSIDSHGSLSNTPSYLVTNDFPNYAGMFYSPTDHEIRNSIKYGNFSQDYSNLREVQQSLNGPDIEFYIPRSFVAEDGVGRADSVQIVPDIVNDKFMEKMREEAFKEITNAQKEVKGKSVKVEFEEVLFIRKTKKTITIQDR